MKCPKCGSSEIHSDKKGFGLGKAAVGAALTGGIGLLAGFIGSSKVQMTCLSCGHKFNPGEGGISYTENNLLNTESITVVEPSKKNFFGGTGEGGNTVSIQANYHIKENKSIQLKQKVVCSCGSMNEIHFNYCRVCGNKIDISKMETKRDGQSFEYDKCSICNRLTPKVSKKCKFCVNCGEPLITQ